MSYEFIITLGKHAILTMLMVCLPVLGFSMVVGIVISVFQSVTQIQEMTITFVPKIVVTFLAMLIFGSWMLSKLTSFLHQIIISIPRISG